MALLGLSLILASVILFCMRRPAWFSSILGAFSRAPLGSSAEETVRDRDTDHHPADQRSSTREELGSSHNGSETRKERTAPASRQTADRIAMPPPPPPPVIRHHDAEVDAASLGSQSTDSQSTPKASAATLTIPVPTLILDSPETTMSNPAPASASASSLMPPPSRPTPSLRVPSTTLSPAPSSSPSSASSSLAAPRNRNLPIPPRGQQQQQQQQPQQQQPGCSTLAPPPTHSSKPAKPSRQVVLTPGHSPLDWARLSGHPTADLRGLGPGSPYLRVTPSMLKRQTGRKGKDAWTVLGGKVYNITPYLPFHPGGEPELLRGAGRDGTRLFGEIHPWVNYEGMLAACLVGIYVTEEEAAEAAEAAAAAGKGGGGMEAMD
ncbi:hypothetical protein MFIFM68171_07556 [Madurella fahalii]|uniref:Cytochrome b5 heme-binding domain-containing protein n=1 Tax=Madurella fahalii TaxID=1157608 RepID=A0ABQ0GHY7_9PEZI